MDKKLPPLPPSDLKSLEKNHFDGFYRLSSKEFWRNNQITREEPEPFKKCIHEFEAAPSGVRCTKCNFGLIGPIEVVKGSLFYKGEPINF